MSQDENIQDIESYEIDENVEYDENQIQILEGLEAVRKRPGMYIGSTSATGLHHCVYEIVDNSVDEALAGFCTQIEVNIHEDNTVSVKDNGRGIPVGIHPQKGIPAVEVVFTILHAGGKFGGGGYKVSGGLHGVGASVVNALSEWLIVRIYHEGNVYEQRYERGNPVNKLEIVDSCDENATGTYIRFKPDGEIFEETVFDKETIKNHLQETAFLTKGLKITLKDLREKENNEYSFQYNGGIKEFVENLNYSRTPMYNDIFYCEGVYNKIAVEVAFQHCDEYYNETNFSYVNNIKTIDGGTHIQGFRTALTKTINDYGRKFGFLKASDKNLSGEDIREGMTSIVSVKIEDPQFEGQTKGKLGTSDAVNAVSAVFSEKLTYYLEENPEIGKTILEKSIRSSKAREAAKRAKELVRRKDILESSKLPGKLTDCSENDPSVCEIYIVEGNSAGGSAVKARDAKTQAILPLRGKILNVEKARPEKILANEEIKSMITAFGTGIHEDFDIDKLRYHKIILMTDADVDGAHITTLLLTFIYRFMPRLIDEGYVYLAQPPLYKIEKGKQERYAYSDEERDNIIEELGGPDGLKPIQRYKGLGEMDASQLWETTMDPEKRILVKVTIEDAVTADGIFSLLMGDKVEPRRIFIQENANYVTNLDV